MSGPPLPAVSHFCEENYKSNYMTRSLITIGRLIPRVYAEHFPQSLAKILDFHACYN